MALCFRGNATSGSNLPALLLVITNPDTTDGFIASKDVLTREQLLVEELQPLALISSLNLPKQAKTSKMEVYHSECLTHSLSLSPLIGQTSILHLD